ncbi:TPA: tRNA-dihydrouridine synthase [Campylobacter lari]|uniref:tRNA dihydrouridine synthase n=1 Tax=Campylobacter sp. FU_497 TaxID=2911610 RepID=UPI0021E63E4C|nr:tRNA-dihydrouridine synthase [Campylobacter sp. FU_497]MCV3462611.1 tRNA-dihydrouridine synthase [Campylobacter sp. FU_497]HEC1759285.1 tRNA-dihydrouridine synthase [Campylobacter lari]
MIDFSKKSLFLAPMAGFSDLPLRNLVKQFGADVTISEMISSNALVYESSKTLKMLEKAELENPYIVQIAGSDESIIQKAVEILNRFDFIDGIDFNCGCPVNKVIKQCAGSALLQDLDKLQRILELIKKTSNKKLTSVKVRLGFDKKDPIVIAKACENAGVDFISMHGRTRKQMYSGNADYEAIALAKENIKIPLVANGDISTENAKEVFEITNCDALMIGRASIGKPWIFYEIKTGKKIEKAMKNKIIFAHFEEMLKHYKEQGISIFRKHLHEYSKGYEDASNFRDYVNRINDADIMRKYIQEFFNKE